MTDVGNNPVVVCRQLTLAYGAEEVLSGIDLEIPAGVLMPLVGPNGSGKSTLLRACLGLVKPRSGELRCDFGPKPPGYVPQAKRLDPLYPVSLRQIVGMGLYPELGFWRRPNTDQRERVRETIEHFGLAGHEHKVFSELSGGMKQKALLARGFVTGADVLILDEPTAGLDAESEHDVLQQVIRLSREQHKTILLAHHRLEDLSHLAETVCVVDRSKAILVSSDEAYRQFTRFREAGGPDADQS